MGAKEEADFPWAHDLSVSCSAAAGGPFAKPVAKRLATCSSDVEALESTTGGKKALRRLGALPRLNFAALPGRENGSFVRIVLISINRYEALETDQ